MAETSTTDDTTRPATHDHLPEHSRQGHLVALIPSDYVTRYPSLGQHLLAALTEADRLGLTITADGRIEIPPTDAELDEALKQAQRTWDHIRDRYAAAMVDPGGVEKWFRYTIDQWAKAEGQPAIVWPAEDVTA